MRPLFTSRQEWQELREAGQRAYLRSAIGHMLGAAAFGLAVLIVVCGATDPHWRSAPVLAVSAVSLLAGGLFSYFLFRREWRAAERAYRGNA
jgi:hypothetical protein